MSQRILVLSATLTGALMLTLSGLADSAPLQLRIYKSAPSKLVVGGLPSVTNISPYVYALDESGQQAVATAPQLDLMVVVNKAFKVNKAYYLGKTSYVKPKVDGNHYSWHVLNYTGIREFFMFIKGVKATKKAACSTATVTISGVSHNAKLCTKVVRGVAG